MPTARYGLFSVFLRGDQWRTATRRRKGRDQHERELPRDSRKWRARQVGCQKRVLRKRRG